MLGMGPADSARLLDKCAAALKDSVAEVRGAAAEVILSVMKTARAMGTDATDGQGIASSLALQATSGGAVQVGGALCAGLVSSFQATSSGDREVLLHCVKQLFMDQQDSRVKYAGVSGEMAGMAKASSVTASSASSGSVVSTTGGSLLDTPVWQPAVLCAVAASCRHPDSSIRFAALETLRCAGVAAVFAVAGSERLGAGVVLMILWSCFLGLVADPSPSCRLEGARALAAWVGVKPKFGNAQVDVKG